MNNTALGAKWANKRSVYNTFFGKKQHLSFHDYRENFIIEIFQEEFHDIPENLKYGEISQKSNENFVVGYTFNLCENYISIVILKQNITNQ